MQVPWFFERFLQDPCKQCKFLSKILQENKKESKKFPDLEKRLRLRASSFKKGFKSN